MKYLTNTAQIYHIIIKKKLAAIKLDVYVDYDVEHNDKILYHRHMYHTSRNRNTLPQTYVISDFNGQEIVRAFYEKEL